MSVRLYIGNLPKELERQDLESIFSDHSEDLVSVKLIADKKTGKCRGFGFVTVKSDEKADILVDKFNGYLLNDVALKVEKALPRSKGTKGESAVSEAIENSGSTHRRNAPASKGSRKSATVNESSAAAQPDPRWAGELEKLKQLLAAQTTSS